MVKVIDLAGQKFGRLTVVRRVGSNASGKAMWECLCEDGVVVSVSSDNLRSGKTKSCGCLRRSTPPNFRDLTGQKFGRLTVVRRVGNNASSNVMWECLCEDGVVVNVSSNSLWRGKTKSCGCLNRSTPPHFRDLSGKKFGRLTVVRRVGTRYGRPLYECRCDCGSVVEVVGPSLRRGLSASCGCLKREILSQRSFVDIAGVTFGRLVAVNRVGTKRGCALWRCLCTCAAVVEVVSYKLLGGNTRSCGCLKVERSTKRFLSIRHNVPISQIPDELVTMQIQYSKHNKLVKELTNELDK